MPKRQQACHGQYPDQRAIQATVGLTKYTIVTRDRL